MGPQPAHPRLTFRFEEVNVCSWIRCFTSLGLTGEIRDIDSDCLMVAKINESIGLKRLEQCLVRKL